MGIKVILSIIIPTCGRPSLNRTLQSMLDTGILKTDEVLVIGDGHQAISKEIVSSFSDKMNVRYIEGEESHYWGHPQANLGLNVSSGTHIARIDDDDLYINGGLQSVRSAIFENPDRINIFKVKIETQNGEMPALWQEKVIRIGNVGSDMVVVPNIKKRLGKYGNRYAGDFDFIRETVNLSHDKDDYVIWRDEIIILYRPSTPPGFDNNKTSESYAFNKLLG